MKHCKTCKHFKSVYPYNKQLGNCVYLQISNLQPCGHQISNPPINKDYFIPNENEICVNRVMDSFGCIYHTHLN